MDVHLSRAIKEIVPEEKRVVGDKGDVFTYEKLLLATGGRPRRLPFDDDQIIYFRTLSDYRRLRAFTETGRRFAVIGGGFIGSEIAAALALNGKEVVMIFPGQDIGERLFPRALSQFVSSFYKQKGVELLADETIVASEARGNQRVLTTATGREIVVDGVVAGVGIEPNIELAQSAGLKPENGITVDEFLRTGHPDIYAAGDVASFHSPGLGTRIRRSAHETEKMPSSAFFPFGVVSPMHCLIYSKSSSNAIGGIYKTFYRRGRALEINDTLQLGGAKAALEIARDAMH